MSAFLNTCVGAIRSGEILALIEELEMACPVGSRLFLNSPLIFFLTQCVYREGTATKRVPLSTEFAPDMPLLDSRIGKLPDGDLRDLCNELALQTQKALEFYAGKKLVVFLNSTLPKYSFSGKPTAKQRLKNSIVSRRRANRC